MAAATIRALFALSAAATLAVFLTSAAEPGSPIRFRHQSIGFVLENGETPVRYAPETMAGGVAVFDYDSDGDLDIFFTNGAEMPSLRKTSAKYSNRLYRNNGAAQFEDVTGTAGLAGSGYDTGAAVADYDNDGDPDLFVGGVHRETLYRNNGDGTFTDVTAEAGLGKADAEHGPLWSVGGAWFDANNDGVLDLFVTTYLRWSPEKEPECLQNGKRDYCHPKYYRGTPNRLYLGSASGRFTDASVASGLRAHVGKGMGAAIADFDADGWIDIFVTNDKLANSFFRNLGAARFQEMAFEAAAAYPERGQDVSGMGSDFRDIDNDGRPDIVFVALENETFPLLRNTGKGYFDEATARSRMRQLSLPMSGYSTGIYDFDNDGWKDIFVSRGHVQSIPISATLAIDQHNTVFRNLGNGTFEALTAAAGFTSQPPRRHRGGAHGDLNNDGRVDVVVTALGAPAEVWLNDSPGTHHWLALKLVGTASNRDGIGAVVKLTTKHGVQYNHVTTAVGYASASSRLVHFGLGADTIAEAIEIRWPSGTVQRLAGVKADRVVEVREPAPVKP